jgi:hypothetical protein
MMRFRDRRHQQTVQAAEKQDPAAQQLIAEFCELINFAYQRQQGLFGVGFYQSVLPVAPMRLMADVVDTDTVESPEEAAGAEAAAEDPNATGGETEVELEPDPGLRMVEGGGGGEGAGEAPNNGETPNPAADKL